MASFFRGDQDLVRIRDLVEGFLDAADILFGEFVMVRKEHHLQFIRLSPEVLDQCRRVGNAGYHQDGKALSR